MSTTSLFVKKECKKLFKYITAHTCRQVSDFYKDWFDSQSQPLNLRLYEA